MKTKNKTKAKKEFSWKITLILLFALMVSFVGVALAGPNFKILNPGSNIRICTGVVSQPAFGCYDAPTANPTLNWSVTGSSSPTQIDLQVFNGSGTLVVDTNLGGSARSYTVPNLNLSSNYSWRVGAWDNRGSWTGWASGGVFTTFGQCKPTAQNLIATNGDFCNLPQINFSWRYTHPAGRSESKYQLQIDNNSSFASPEVDITRTITASSGAINAENIRVKESPGTNELAYNNSYYWRVMVWDNANINSGWINGPVVTTPKHKYPEIDFSYIPNPIKEDTPITFSDDSQLFGGATVSQRSWSFSGGSPSSSSSSKPVVTFSSSGGHNISLTVRDSDGYQCSKSETVTVEKSLKWIETP